MATALPDTTPPAPTKFDARVEEQLGKAAGKIRAHDLLTGALALVVLTLAYAVAGILLDQALELPQWVRQLGFAGFLLALVGLGYALVVRPLRQAINPRYAARRVEQTIPDAKNAVINWVDLRDEGLPDPVRAAVGSRAVDEVTVADVNRVGESRRLVWLGAAAGLLAATVAALVVILKPAPFLSHVGRTFNPFASTAIATRTKLDLIEPPAGNVTVTADDPLRIAVHVGGTVPDPDDPDRLRLQVRYTQEAAAYDELPLEEAGSAREWAIQVPRSVIQNGFWYRVAGGDTATPEYRVTVRSRPIVKGFEAVYDYPDYTRMKTETGREAELRAYRGTQVTLTVATNRKVKKGEMWIDGQPDDPIRAEVVPGETTDSLRFRLTLTRNSTYRINFTSAEDEPSEPTPAYPIRVLTDQKPTVVLDPLPAGEEGQPIPATGLLKVNGWIGDDFGIDTAALRLKLHHGAVAIDLQPKPYRDGKSFRRESDNSWPTTLQYKDSVELPKLADDKGQPVKPSEGMELEYWLEATDNCTVPKPNVGRSPSKRVKIGPAEENFTDKLMQNQARQQRKKEEDQHRKQQDQQFQTEQRDAPQPLHQNQPPQQNQPKPEGQDQGAPKTAEGQPGEGDQPPKAGDPPAKSETAPMPTEAGKGQDNKTLPDAPAPESPKGGQPDTPNPIPGATPPETPKGTPDAPMPRIPQDQPNPEPKKPTAADPKVQEQAEKVREAIEQQQHQPGQARPQEPTDPKAEQQSPAEPKPGEPQPGTGAESKPGAQADPKGQPMGEPPSEARGAGDLDRTDPSRPKPEPKAGEPSQAGTPSPQPTDSKPGEMKPGAEGTQPQPKPGEMKGTDPGTARPAADPKATPEKDPKGGTDPAEPKGMPDPARGQERPATQPQSGEPPAQGRDQKPTDPAQAKPQGPGQPEKLPAADPKPAAQGTDPQRPDQAPADPKPAGTTDPKAGEKPSPTPGQPQGAKGDGPKQKMDPKEMEQALKDLAGDDEAKKQAARDKLDKSVGQDARKQAEKIAEDLKSGDPEKQQAARKAAEQLSRKTSPDGQPAPPDESVERLLRNQANANQPKPGELSRELDKDGKPVPPPPDENVERLVRDKADDLASDDPQRRQAAEKELDSKIGKEAREEFQKKAQDLKSPNPATREAARKDLDELAKRSAQNAQGGQPQQQPTKEEIEQLAKTAPDLASPDEAKRKAAEQEFDRKIGKENRERLQKDVQDLTSGDKDRQEAARKRLEDMSNKAGQPGKGQPPSKEEMEKWANKAKDLASDDPAKREAAEKEFDQAVGKEQREQLQKQMQDLKSGDKDRQAAAQKRLEEMAKKGDPSGKGQPPSKEEIEQLARKAQDLNSPDPAKREAAEKEFDQRFGKDQREQLQQNLKDLQSKDQAKQEAARQRLQDMARAAADKGSKGERLSPEDIDQLKKQAEDLASQDEAKRKAAEEAFDQKIGKDLREKIQKEMEDLKSGDPQKQAEARQRLQEMANNLPKGPNDPSDPSRQWRPGPGGKKEENAKPLEDNPANRLKTAELQLEQFEKQKYNKELLNKLGYTPEEYEEFLKAYREMVSRQREEVAKAAEQPKDQPPPTGPAPLKVGEGSGNKALEKKGTGTAVGGAAGTGTAPPGYGDAQRKFAEKAGNMSKDKK